VAHFDKGSADRNSVLSVEEKGTNFGFRGGSCYSTQRFAEDVDGAVGFGSGRTASGRRESGQEKMTNLLPLPPVSL
jgi:hypothetical protein